MHRILPDDIDTTLKCQETKVSLMKKKRQRIDRQLFQSSQCSEVERIVGMGMTPEKAVSISADGLFSPVQKEMFEVKAMPVCPFPFQGDCLKTEMQTNFLNQIHEMTVKIKDKSQRIRTISCQMCEAVIPTATLVDTSIACNCCEEKWVHKHCLQAITIEWECIECA
jgi:hypothetical protein